MLQFIKDNAVLCTGVFSIVAALISALVTLIVNRNTEKSKTITELKTDLKEAKKELQEAQDKLHKAEQELKEFQSIENAEQNIDKGHGSIYKEKMPDGSTRDICAYCWEREHKKIPINTELVYNDFGPTYYGARCRVCDKYCEEEYCPF